MVNGRPILEESHGVDGPTGPTVHLGAVPYPSPANTAFTPDTIPSSRSPRGGGLPVHVTDIRACRMAGSRSASGTSTSERIAQLTAKAAK